MSVVVIDKALQDLSVMLFDCPDDPTPYGELLSEDKLDFTLESLQYLEDFLDEIRAHQLTGKSLAMVVLRTGAYVGEVIRRQTSTRRWHWLERKEACKLDPAIATFADRKSLHTRAILWDSKERFCFPLGKVEKYLENGKADSVQFFAEVTINNPT